MGDPEPSLPPALNAAPAAETNGDAPPPFHATDGNDGGRRPSESLPEYEPSKSPIRSRRNPITERVFTLDNSKGKPWAFLKVNSRGSSQSPPNFFEGDLVSGTVELDLEKTESFVAIMLEIKGESLAVGQEPIPFYSENLTLWSPNNSNQSGSSSSKLKGKYVWPYSAKLPDKVAVPSVAKGPVSDYRLPPSFSERASPAYLEYKIIVTFKRGLLRANSTLMTLFAYLPRNTPPACSSLRQLAYQENSAPPPPKIDPEGWHDLGPKSVTGIVFETRQIDVSAVFFLAKPLSYTRGLFIPFTLTLSCLDTQALDLFCARGSLKINLKRSLRIGSTAAQGKALNERTDTSFDVMVAEGVYWLAENNVPSSETRTLEGEIPLKPDLKPTFVFPNVTVKYAVVFALTVPGFVVLSNNGEAPVYEQEVEVATLMPPGAVPQSRSGAVMKEGASSSSSGNYDVSIGVLTQANQRFIHLGHHGMG